MLRAVSVLTVRTTRCTLVVDGRDHSINEEPGYFVGPTLFDNATQDMRVYQEEIFGPVLTMVRVDSFDEAIRLVNEEHRSVSEVERNLDISRGTLARWVREYNADPVETFPGKGRLNSKDEEIRRLKNELKKAR